MDEPAPSGSDNEVNEVQHSNLLTAVSQLDTKQLVKPPSRKEPSSEVSEFHLVKDSDKNAVKISNLTKVLGQRGSHAQISKKLRSVQQKSKTLSRPLEKPVAARIKRKVGFQNVKHTLGRWDAVVHSNRANEQLKFPLKQTPFEPEDSNSFIQKLKLQDRTPLEAQMDEILNSSPSVQEERKAEEEYQLTLAEMIEHRREMAKMRAQMSYMASKASRQNKIKSKKYHRLQRRERIRQQLKDFEILQKTDPEAALKQLEQLERTRAEERVSLRHRSTGQWARNKAVRAKYDKESRQELAQQLSISRDLTQKIQTENSSDEETGEDGARNETKISGNSDNPWIATETTSEIGEFISGYRKYWEKQAKISKENTNSESFAIPDEEINKDSKCVDNGGMETEESKTCEDEDIDSSDENEECSYKLVKDKTENNVMKDVVKNSVSKASSDDDDRNIEQDNTLRCEAKKKRIGSKTVKEGAQSVIVNPTGTNCDSDTNNNSESREENDTRKEKKSVGEHLDETVNSNTNNRSVSKKRKIDEKPVGSCKIFTEEKSPRKGKATEKVSTNKKRKAFSYSDINEEEFKPTVVKTTSSWIVTLVDTEGETKQADLSRQKRIRIKGNERNKANEFSELFNEFNELFNNMKEKRNKTAQKKSKKWKSGFKVNDDTTKNIDSKSDNEGPEGETKQAEINQRQKRRKIKEIGKNKANELSELFNECNKLFNDMKEKLKKTVQKKSKEQNSGFKVNEDTPKNIDSKSDNKGSEGETKQADFSRQKRSKVEINKVNESVELLDNKINDLLELYYDSTKDLHKLLDDCNNELLELYNNMEGKPKKTVQNKSKKWKSGFKVNDDTTKNVDSKSDNEGPEGETTQADFSRQKIIIKGNEKNKVNELSELLDECKELFNLFNDMKEELKKTLQKKSKKQKSGFKVDDTTENVDSKSDNEGPEGETEQADFSRQKRRKINENERNEAIEMLELFDACINYKLQLYYDNTKELHDLLDYCNEMRELCNDMKEKLKKTAQKKSKKRKSGFNVNDDTTETVDSKSDNEGPEGKTKQADFPREKRRIKGKKKSAAKKLFKLFDEFSDESNELLELLNMQKRLNKITQKYEQKSKKWTSDFIVNDTTKNVDSKSDNEGPEGETKQADFSRRNIKEYGKNKANAIDCNELEELFDDAEEKLKKTLQKKFRKLKSGFKVIEDTTKNVDSESDNEGPSMEMKKETVKPELDDELVEEIQNSIPQHRDIRSDVDLNKSIAQSDVEPQEPQLDNIDPNKFLAMKPKHLHSELPDMITAGDEAIDDNEDDNRQQQMVITEAFAEDDVVAEFKKEKEDAVESSKPQDVDLTLPGWGEWGGKNLTVSPRKKRRFIIKFPTAPPRKDANKGSVIINEEKNDKVKVHQVSELPFPFTSVKDFEASIRAPIGSTWIPETAHRKLIRPAVVTKLGTVIQPMDEDVLVNKKKILKEFT